MNQHTLEVLEINKIIDSVKEYAGTKPGKKIIANLSPINDINYIDKELEKVTVGKEMLENYGSPPFGGIRDLREILKKANKGMVLSLKEIVNVNSSLTGFNSLKHYFEKIIEDSDPEIIEKRYSLLTEKGIEIQTLNSLIKKINNCVNEYGEMKDDASQKLNSLRKQMDSIENKIRDKLEGIIRNTKYQSMLQDSLITRRENRYVVPVKKEYHNTFSGIVHDHSASGMTVFMEPMAIVKLNNRLREVKAEEEAEIYRILQTLTSMIQAETNVIKSNLRITLELDVVFARAHYSSEIDGIGPAINEEGIIDIKKGRHPLLQDKPVPIGIEVGKDFKTLVITGPNTGGKTVALKTVGLFVCMVEMGLHIPVARGTNISIFDKVFADIGDEQSIEQNLSTFSSHMNKIRKYLKQADNSSLVLLDELGAGTDPREGAALGIAILEELRSNQVITVATTHYSQLKSYAYSFSGVENASVEFDIETLQPTYRFIMGIPGGSNAFQIALKLGLPEKIIDKAREQISSGELKVESIIAELNRDRKKYGQLKKEVEKKNREIGNIKKKYEQKFEKLKNKKDEILKEARTEADQIIKKTRKQSKNIISRIKDEDYFSRPEVDRTATEVNKELKKIKSELDKEREVNQDNNKNKHIEIGDQVRVKSVGQKGEVLSIDNEKERATVQAGVMKVTTGLNELTKVDMPESHKEEMVKNYQVTKSQKVSPSIDLRGDRYGEAQKKLDKYLDDAFLAGYKNVEIIHGKGSGVLREAVSEVLEEHPHIPSYRLGRQEEGGMGVTIATLEQ